MCCDTSGSQNIQNIYKQKQFREKIIQKGEIYLRLDMHRLETHCCRLAAGVPACPGLGIGVRCLLVIVSLDP